MGFQKFQSTEKVDLVSPEGHEAIEEELHKAGKSSMANADAATRQRVAKRLEDEESD